jgi:hypothetical protein
VIENQVPGGRFFTVIILQLPSPMWTSKVPEMKISFEDVTSIHSRVSERETTRKPFAYPPKNGL